MIGILGGTFDPVHFGHLRPALEVKQALALDEIRLVPCHAPPHRPQPVASPQQRSTMLRLAVEKQPGFVVDEREFDRAGPSYTLDTLLSLREDFSSKTLCLLVGMDAFRGLASWHRWHELLNHCHLVVMTRPGAALPKQGEVADYVRLHRVQSIEKLRAQSAGMLYFQTVSQLDISGTDLRSILSQNRPADFLLPARVLEFIHTHDLYRK